jgi:MFS family permease
VIEMRVRAPMVDFVFFRSRSFLGANVVGFFVSFAMLAQFFFLALYMQNILGYSPLQSGLRFLPSTLVLVVMGPLAGRLTDKVGPRPLMTLGLMLVSGSIFLQSGITVHTSYVRLLPGFVLMGLGIGLVMSPMSTAAMNSVDRTKAGAASGVLSMSRMVGGTFGVAVMGALISALGRSNIDSRLPQLPASTRAHLASALGSGGSPAAAHGLPASVISGVREAFVSALGSGLEIGAITTLCGAIAAWVLIEKKLRSAAAPVAAVAPRGDDAAADSTEAVTAEPAVR